VYLGIRQWRSAAQPLEIDTKAVPVAPIHLFAQGLAVTVPNPKSLVFIAAFLPQFMDVARPAGPQFAVIVPTFLIITFTVTSGWALLAGRAGRTIRNRRGFRPLFRAAGMGMILAGIGLGLARRGG
jgi:threonine/homoserine/homoserine lactone efflux protein